MKTLLEVLNLSTDFLKQKGVLNPRKETQEILCDVFGMNRLDLYMQYDRPLVESELEILRKRVMRRAKGEPFQYIHGEVEFHDCKIKVTPAVLIPRQETGILVDKIIQTLSKLDLQGKVLWDVCTGSGCIGIALKKRFPQLDIKLSDLSKDALAIARENALRNEVEVDIFEGDLLRPFEGSTTDFLVCNPPYVSESEHAALEKEVREYEPKIALVSGSSGLEFYERLSKEIVTCLNPEAKVWFEIGDRQGNDLLTLFSAWTKIRVERDWSDRDRFFFLEIE